MKINKLGIFDSGLGGYSVYHDLMDSGPNIEYILYSDQKNAPYGNKEAKKIIGYVTNAMEWFQKEGINNVLLACNTASALALDSLRNDFPKMNIWGIIDLTLNEISEDDASIAVVSTLATYHSHAYKNTWQKEGLIYEYPLPKLVAYIENLEETSLIHQYIEEESQKIAKTDYLILACTHYPLVYDGFEKHFDSKIIDSRLAIRKHVYKIASLDDDGKKHSRIYTSGDAKHMEKQIKTIFKVTEKVRSL